MTAKDPYTVIQSRYTTEKTQVLSQLKDSESSASLRRFKSPKHVFIVDEAATKQDIARAVETIYASRKVAVVKVNTVNVKPKPKRMRTKVGGYTRQFKKAIVTLRPEDSIDEV